MRIEDRLYVDTDAGIYYFRNILNNKYYIGQAINIKKRLIHHLNNLSHERYKSPLYKALQKYGIENFEFGILKRVEKSEIALKNVLDFWEKYYIVLHNSYGSTGYNQTKGGDSGVLGFKMTKEQKKHISINSKIEANDGRNTVFCYDILSKEIIQCSSLVTLGIYLNINIRTVAIKNILIAKQYIVSRTLGSLKEKINKYNLRENSNTNYNKKITSIAIQDIKSGMSQKDWTDKYNLCRATYFQYKRKLKCEIQK